MKAQQWSLEAILAISVFIIVFVFVIAFISYRPLDQTKQLELQSVKIFEKTRSDAGFIEGSKVSDAKLSEWFTETNNTEDLAAFKKELGLTDDFCIYFENEGETIPRVLEGTGESFYGVGDSTITIGDVPCGQVIS